MFVKRRRENKIYTLSPVEVDKEKLQINRVFPKDSRPKKIT